MSNLRIPRLVLAQAIKTKVLREEASQPSRTRTANTAQCNPVSFQPHRPTASGNAEYALQQLDRRSSQDLFSARRKAHQVQLLPVKTTIARLWKSLCLATDRFRRAPHP